MFVTIFRLNLHIFDTSAWGEFKLNQIQMKQKKIHLIINITHNNKKLLVQQNQKANRVVLSNIYLEQLIRNSKKLFFNK